MSKLVEFKGTQYEEVISFQVTSKEGDVFELRPEKVSPVTFGLYINGTRKYTQNVHSAQDLMFTSKDTYLWQRELGKKKVNGHELVFSSSFASVGLFWERVTKLVPVAASLLHPGDTFIGVDEDGKTWLFESYFPNRIRRVEGNQWATLSTGFKDVLGQVKTERELTNLINDHSDRFRFYKFSVPAGLNPQGGDN